MTPTRILVVEDNAALAVDLSMLLSAYGYDVVGVEASGRDALVRIAELRPDAVLMDIGLTGDMDGIETAAHIPASFEIAVIYLSGSSAEATLNRARETKPYGYLIKPFSDRELHATIQMALERHRAARELRAAEHRLEKANAALQVERDNAQRYLDVAGVMIVKVDVDGAVTLINKRGCDILGYDHPAQIIGKNWIEWFVPSRLKDGVVQQFRRMMSIPEQDATLQDLPVVTRNGGERIIAWRTVILSAGGLATGALSSGDDVTERYRAEADQRRLAAIVESSDAAIVGQSLDGIVTDWNRAAERIFGYAAEEMVGRSVSALFPPEIADEMDRVHEQVRFGAQISNYETIRRRKSGRSFPVLLSISPIRDLSGRIVGISKIANDITELQEARTEREALYVNLRKAQERLLAAQRISQTGHWEYDGAHDQLWLSDHVFDLIGVDKSEFEVSLAAFLALVHPDDRGLLCTLSSRGAGSKPLNIEHRIVSPDGSIRWLHLLADIEVAPDRRETLVGTIQNITERKNAEARLHELQSELLHVSRLSAMGQIGSMLAHEVNQPLTAIGNYIRAALLMLESGNAVLSPKVRSALDKAAQQASRASDIVANLREFVRKGDATRRTELLAPLVADAIALARLGLDSRTVEIRLRFEQEAQWAEFNRIQIQQVLVNLIRNAIEAMDGSAERQITITATSADRDLIEIVVADTGPGLSPARARDLFRPFSTTKPHGMGVGLAICRSIVDAHGGKIWFEPGERGGASFHFTVPRASAPNIPKIVDNFNQS